MAGISCAARLAEAGLSPVVMEKSRGLGGRLATRRLPGGMSIDHGAQFVSAGAGPFRHFLETGAEAGTLARWRPRMRAPAPGEDWLVGVPAMNSPLKAGAAGLDIRLSLEVSEIRPGPCGWTIACGAEEAGLFDIVIVTAPAPQAARLAGAAPGLASRIGAARMAPCWTVMLVLSRPAPAGQDVFIDPAPGISWLARNSSKPGRPDEESWVVQMSAELSRSHLEDAPDKIVGAVLAQVTGLIEAQATDILHASAHRWRYAHVTRPIGQAFLSNEAANLIAAGDWCLGAGVEAAYQSGRSAAEEILQQVR